MGIKLNSLIFAAISILSSNKLHAQERPSCSVSETRNFVADDVVAITEFVAEKNCNIEQPSYAATQSLITNLDTHGCWCNVIDPNNALSPA